MKCWLPRRLSFRQLASLAVLPLFIGIGGCDSQPPSGRPGSSASGEAARPAPEPSLTAEEADRPVGPVDEPPQLLSDAERQDGWIALFDGRSLFGWQAGSDANWRVEEGTIVVDSGEPGLLCTTSPFDDYVLRLEFNSDPATNSGVFLRTQIDPGDVSADCYELNIAPADNPFPTGGLVRRAKADGDWNRDGWQTYEITVSGPQVRVVLDGQQVLDYQDPAPIGRGFIGLQLNQGRVAFRNIHLKPLGLIPIFNGEDLSGWKNYPDMQSKFTVTRDGLLQVQDGPGQLETESEYGDFILQLECRVNAPELNSGIFFRCIPGATMMGYESQIHNGFLAGDRASPKDCGTGGIFRRQNARLVVADDLTWFQKTLIVDGPHMAAWVNGYAVSDWTDSRAPDANPRRGRRTEPGTIIIQGHDPTTNLSFRNLRIREIQPRQTANAPQ